MSSQLTGSRHLFIVLAVILWLLVLPAPLHGEPSGAPDGDLPTPTATPSASATSTSTATATPTPTATSASTATATAASTPTATATATYTPTATPSPTATSTATGTPSSTPTATPSTTATPTPTATPAGPSATPTPTATPSGYAVSGTVYTNSATGQKAQGGQVQLYQAGVQAPVVSEPIGPDGTYLLRYGVPGSYQIRARVNRFYPVNYDITIPSPAMGSTTRDFDLGASNPYTVTGSVTGLPSAAMADIMASAKPAYSPVPGMNAFSGVNAQTAQFTFRLPAGDWMIFPPSVVGYAAPIAQVVHVDSSQTSQTLAPFVYSAGHTLSGIVSASGTPVVGGRVDAFRTSDMNFVGGSNLEAGGAYSLTLPAGSYQLRAQKTGYFPPTRTYENLSANQTSQDFDIITSNPYTITGIVSGLPGGSLSQARVRAHRSSQYGPGPEAEATPAADGSYTLRVPEGSFRVTAEQVSGYGRPNEVVLSVSGATPSATANFAYAAGYSVTGVVTNPQGTPVAGAGLHLYNADHSVDQSGGTNMSGSYEIGGLQNGTYTLELMPPWGTTGLVAPSPATVTISGGNVVQNLSFQAATKRLTGTVRRDSSSGAGVSTAMVFANKADGGNGASAATGESGTYELWLGPGSWNVNLGPDFTAGAPDWSYDRPPTIITFANDSSNETQSLDFVVSSTNSSVSGRVLRPGGTPQSGGFVGLRSMDGRGGGGPIQGDGTFTVPVAAGTYQVMIFAGSQQLSAPTGLSVTVNSGQSYSMSDIQLTQRSSRITGRVTRSDTGAALANVRLHAQAIGGGEWSDSQTDANGNYTLWVSAGWWRVNAVPASEDAFAGSEGAEVTVTDGEATVLNIQLQPADGTIVGRTVLASNPSQAITNLFGGGFAFKGALEGTGPGMSAPLQGGRFQLRVPAGTWQVSVGLPPGSGYSPSGDPQSVTVATGQTVEVTIPLVANDSVIRGYLRLYPEGTAVTGLNAPIFAGNGRGGGTMANIDPTTGYYELRVAAGTWDRHVELPSGSGYSVRPGQQMAVTVNNGQTVDADIQVVAANRTISGTVTAPGGSALPGAFVAVENPALTGRERFVAGGRTDGSGAYSVSVPPGSYELLAQARFELGYTAPAPLTVDVSSANATGINFAFLASNATLSGVVSPNGAGVRSMVRAHSTTGSGAQGFTDSSGNFTLNLREGTWRIEAVGHDSTKFYKSAEVEVVVTAGGNVTQNLSMVEQADLPSANSSTFDATTMQVIRLSDGTELRIPAGALATSGTVTVSASPNTEVPVQGGVRPVSLGYTLLALDSSGQAITSFNQNVTIVLHYTHAQLTALGITESDLTASYWDENSSAWQSVANMTVDPDADTVSISVDHFTDFALTSKNSSSGATPTPTPTQVPSGSGSGDSGGGAPAPTSTPVPTSTVVPATPATQQIPSQTAQPASAAPAPFVPTPVPADERYFKETGFRISNDAFWSYFSRRGGTRALGYPISREFTLLGFRVQMFQRALLQLTPDGVRTMNLADGGMLPYNRINSSSFPTADRELLETAPQVGSLDYEKQVQAFLRTQVPDEVEGASVGFYSAYMDTVRYEEAYPEGGADPALVTWLNVERWGLPTSKPVRDPANHNFVYQRFQRGILHYDASSGATQAILLADYLKSVMTGQNLPADLASQAQFGAFYRQYDPAKPGYLARPELLPGSDLTGAFEKDVVQEPPSALGVLAFPLGLAALGLRSRRGTD